MFVRFWIVCVVEIYVVVVLVGGNCGSGVWDGGVIIDCIDIVYVVIGEGG